MSKYRKTEYKSRCPRCAENGRDTSGNNLHNYGEGNGAFCFSCGHTILSDEERDKRGLNNFDEFYEESMGKENITQEELDEVKETTGTKGHGLRGITDSTYKTFAVRHSYCAETGKPLEQYYPCFFNGELSGFKVRILPKSFTTIGKVSKDGELFGYFKFKQSRGKYILITAGEIDCMSAYQMLEDYRKSRGSEFDPIPVVSSVVGESASDKQVQQYYEYFNKFEKVVVCFDMDQPGREAVEKVAKVLPKGKVYVMDLPLKDINEMLEQGKEKQFIDAFFKAKTYTPTGVVGSSDLFEAMVDASVVEKLPFPPAYTELNEMLAGGVALGTIGVISAFTGIAKTTIVNEILFHWIFNSPHKIAVVSMEQSKAQFGELMLSRHMGVKLGKMFPEQKREFLQKPETKLAAEQLFKCEDGSDRFFVIDDRDMEIESMKQAIEKAVIACDARVIIWDTISDAMDALTVEEQAHVMKWCKSLVAMYNCSLILIAHQKKPPAGAKDGSQGGMGTESGVQGSSTITKSATWILMLARDKVNDDPIVRNTTVLELTKNRDASDTGPAGELYYEVETHTIHNKNDYFNSRGGEFYG